MPKTNYRKNIFVNHGFFWVYTFSQVLFLLFANRKTTEIKDINIESASQLHLVSILMFVTSYFIFYVLANKNINQNQYFAFVKLNSKYAFYSYFFCVFGLITTFSTILMIVSIPEYFALYLSSRASEILKIKYEAGNSGLSGVLKMFNFAPGAVFMINASIMFFLNYSDNDRKVLKKIHYFSLIAVIVKSLIILDRLSILLIFVVYFYKLFFNPKSRALTILIFSFFGYFILDYITKIRMNTSIIDFLTIYCKSGLVNLEIVMQTQKKFFFNFGHSFLAPLKTILSQFDITVFNIDENYHFSWDPAQYFNSYLYLDFEYYSLFIYIILGVILSKLELDRRRNKIYAINFYYIIFFTIITFIAVPFIRAVEFWLILCIAIFYIKLVKKVSHKRKITNNNSYYQDLELID